MNMRCLICNDDKYGHAILCFPHPYRQGVMRIVDAENWARIMGQEKTHVVALADRRITWIREPDHGQMNAEEIMSLSPRGMEDEVYDILHGPDGKAPNETDAEYLPRAQLEARFVRTSAAARLLKTQQMHRVEQERELEETKRCIYNLERQVVMSLFAPDFPPPEDGNDET